MRARSGRPRRAYDGFGFNAAAQLVECLDSLFICGGARVPLGFRCFNRALRLFALSGELLELTARFFEERERPSLSLVDLADEPLFQLQARELAEGLHSLATQARGLFSRGP